MSSIFRKIEYVEPGEYGITVKRKLYVRLNGVSDSVEICDDSGDTIFSYIEWGLGSELDLGKAISKILTSNCDDLESMNPEEIKEIFKKAK